MRTQNEINKEIADLRKLHETYPKDHTLALHCALAIEELKDGFDPEDPVLANLDDTEIGIVSHARNWKSGIMFVRPALRIMRIDRI